MLLPKTICLLSTLVTFSFASPNCKLSPADSAWPSTNEWAALNRSIDGVLVKTAPIASSCYPGNPFNSPENCTSVQDKWYYAAHHAVWPESVDYPIYSNNSCVPKGVTGYAEGKGCNIGGLPQYIVNATTIEHVSKAMSWASKRNIRIVVKGTGHDLNGRYVLRGNLDLLHESLILAQINGSICAFYLDAQFQTYRKTMWLEIARPK